MIHRRSLLKSLSAGAGGLVLSPFLQQLAAQEQGTYKAPKRVVFVLFGNGFHEFASMPDAVSMTGQEVRQLPLDPLALPHDIEPFTPFALRG